MIKELETVELVKDIPEHHLKAGDLGAVVFAHIRVKKYEVEFAATDGSTIALLTLSSRQIRPVTARRAIMHIREFA